MNTSKPELTSEIDVYLNRLISDLETDLHRLHRAILEEGFSCSRQNLLKHVKSLHNSTKHYIATTPLPKENDALPTASTRRSK